MSVIQSLSQQIRDPEFWRSLNPGLSITEGSDFKRWSALEPDNLEDLLANLQEDGYFQIDSLLPDAEIFALAIAVSSLYEEGLPPTFAFVYDEFWQILQRLSGIFSAVLGEGYQQLPSFWAWYIDTANDQMGWGPHRDRSMDSLLPNGMPKIITAWIPLTDAIPLNGCMYLLPASRDPDYGKPSPEGQVSLEAMKIPYTQLQNVRALPAAAGSVLCWNQAVLHWGSRSSEKAPFPRISFSCEFQRSDVEPLSPLLLDPLKPLTFDQRLALIGTQIVRYQHMYELPQDMADLALELQNLLVPAFT